MPHLYFNAKCLCPNLLFSEPALFLPFLSHVQTYFSATNNVGDVAAKEEVWEVTAQVRLERFGGGRWLGKCDSKVPGCAARTLGTYAQMRSCGKAH